MWLDLILLNMLAFFGSLGLTMVICLGTESWWGLFAMASMFIFVNWTWWSVHFNNFHWLLQ